MVQNESSSSPDSTPIVETRPLSPITAKGVPCGKYKLIGMGIDTTGRRLIDEIVQIAAYTPKAQFSQYIMPFGDLNPLYRRRHNVSIINADRYRMLKDTKTNKYIKTKSEISALTDFVKWLEDNRGDAAPDGVILIYHEIKKFSLGVLLEALQRCYLLERFDKVVKGFVNSYDVAKAKCANITKSFALRVLSRVLLNKEEDFDSAVDVSRAAFCIVAHLAQSERKDLEDAKPETDGTEEHFVKLVCPYANPISAEQEEIADLKVLLERQNTFKPVFGALLRASYQERKHATHLRKLLAENNINYEKLKGAYEAGGKEGLDKVLKTELFQVANAKEKDVDELLEILDCFFDPEKKAVRPKQRFQNGNNRPYHPRNNRRKSSSSKTRNSASEASPTASSENPTVSASNESSPRSEGEATVVAAPEKVPEAATETAPAPAAPETAEPVAVN